MQNYLTIGKNFKFFQDTFKNKKHLKKLLKANKVHFSDDEDLKKTFKILLNFFEDESVEEGFYTHTNEKGTEISIVKRKLNAYNSALHKVKIKDIFPENGKKLQKKVLTFIENLNEELRSHEQFVSNYSVGIEDSPESFADFNMMTVFSVDDYEKIVVDDVNYIVSYSIEE